MIKNKRIWVVIGGISGFLGVAIGAFGAHSLKNYLTPEMIEVYKTGVLYQLIHSVVVLAIGLSGNEKFKIPALLITIGIILFSFSLYLYSLTNEPAFAIITPLGGVCFLIGWLTIVITSFLHQ